MIELILGVSSAHPKRITLAKLPRPAHAPYLRPCRQRLQRSPRYNSRLIKYIIFSLASSRLCEKNIGVYGRTLFRNGLGTLILISIVSACGNFSARRDGPPSRSIDVSRIPNAVPKIEARSRSGNASSYVVFGKRYYVMDTSQGYEKIGIASWYGKLFHGRRTSNGEIFDMYAMTAAHTSLPLPTYVEVTNLTNQKKIIVRVNDRGPFHGNRIIDLSYVAARKLGIVATGTAQVRIRAIGRQALSPGKKVVANLDRPMAKISQRRFVDAAFYLQIGAFRQLNNAQRLVSKLLSIVSDPVYIQPAPSKLGVVHRVWIGPFDTRFGVEKLEIRLTQNGIKDTRIVAK